MRLLRLLTAGAAIGGAIVLVKRLMEQQAEAPTAQDAPSTPKARPASAPGPSSSNGGEPTNAELYERAQELGIEGRSKMSKRELQRAIEAARG